MNVTLLAQNLQLNVEASRLSTFCCREDEISTATPPSTRIRVGDSPRGGGGGEHHRRSEHHRRIAPNTPIVGTIKAANTVPQVAASTTEHPLREGTLIMRMKSASMP